MEKLDASTLHVVASFLGVRELKAMELTNKFNYDAIQLKSSLWRDHFVRRWSKINFSLNSKVPLHISPLLIRHCGTENASFRLLVHVIKKVPSYADIDQTHESAMYTNEHRFRALEHLHGREYAPVKILFDGTFIGGNRCVRGNKPFVTTPHAKVFLHKDEYGNEKYHVGLSSNGYFEITISAPDPSSISNNTQYVPQPFDEAHHMLHLENLLATIFTMPNSECVSIGLADKLFKLDGNQPGWRGMSFGYHGDDGNFFHASSRGKSYGNEFGTGDTVGCGILNGSTLIFTLNGTVVGPPISTSTKSLLFPVVGIDSENVIQWNFGQDSFKYNAESLFTDVSTSLTVDNLRWEEESVDEFEDSEFDNSEIGHYRHLYADLGIDDYAEEDYEQFVDDEGYLFDDYGTYLYDSDEGYPYDNDEEYPYDVDDAHLYDVDEGYPYDEEIDYVDGDEVE